MRADFEALADAVCTAVPGMDRVMLSFSAESSDFVRFNQAAVRQATHVEQRYGTVSVVAGRRRARGTVTLTGDRAADTAALLAQRAALAGQLPWVPEDKHLLLPETVGSTTRVDAGRLPAAVQVIDAVQRHAAGTDFVGFHASGPVVRAFADSRGQRNWHQVESFLFDWCLYRGGDQAVKTSYAGTAWDDAEFARRVAQARERLALLERPRRTLAPGDYRAFFSPVAVAEILSTLKWGGFGLKERRTGTSTLIALERGEARLHDGVALREATGDGIAPGFQAEGFVRPASVDLILGGASAGALTSARSAREYGVPGNGANGEESPESLSLAPGSLPMSDALAALGTGVYLSDLHYLNYSDRQACRLTGMTRFACFWVERGELAAPIGVMRFDDSFLRMFGSGLVALTRETDFQPDAMTYGERQLASVRAPGALVEGFRFTL